MSAPVRELQPQALGAFMALLQDTLNEHGSITLRAVKTVPVGVADVTFDTRRVRLTRGLSRERFVDALTHELVHLQRGPALVDEVDAEEVAVEDTAQRLLYGEPRPVKRERHLTLIPGGAR